MIHFQTNQNNAFKSQLSFLNTKITTLEQQLVSTKSELERANQLLTNENNDLKQKLIYLQEDVYSIIDQIMMQYGKMKDQYTMIDNVYKEYKLDVTKNNQEYEREIDLYKHLNSTYDLFCFLHRPSQKDKITDLEKQIQINTEMIQNYVGSIEESSNERKRLLSKLSELQTQFEEQSKELTQYKQREQVIEKKEMEAIDSIKTQMSNSTVELALKEKGLNTVELYNKCISLQKQLDAEKYLRSNVELYISFERVHD